MEPGAMVHINEGVEPSMKIGGCGDCCAGESLFRLKYQNTTGVQQSVSLTPVFPAKVVPVDLTRYSGMVIQKGAYFATTGTELKIGVFMPVKLGACIGAGALLLSTISGNGIAFLSGGGTILQVCLLCHFLAPVFIFYSDEITMMLKQVVKLETRTKHLYYYYISNHEWTEG